MYRPRTGDGGVGSTTTPGDDDPVSVGEDGLYPSTQESYENQWTSSDEECQRPLHTSPPPPLPLPTAMDSAQTAVVDAPRNDFPNSESPSAPSACRKHEGVPLANTQKPSVSPLTKVPSAATDFGSDRPWGVAGREGEVAISAGHEPTLDVPANGGNGGLVVLSGNSEPAITKRLSTIGEHTEVQSTNGVNEWVCATDSSNPVGSKRYMGCPVNSSVLEPHAKVDLDLPTPGNLPSIGSDEQRDTEADAPGMSNIAQFSEPILGGPFSGSTATESQSRQGFLRYRNSSSALRTQRQRQNRGPDRSQLRADAALPRDPIAWSTREATRQIETVGITTGAGTDTQGYSHEPIALKPPLPEHPDGCFRRPLNPFAYNYYYREGLGDIRGMLGNGCYAGVVRGINSNNPGRSVMAGYTAARGGEYDLPPCFNHSQQNTHTYPAAPPPLRAAQPEREVPTGTFYCFLLLRSRIQGSQHQHQQQPVRLLRVECNSLLMDDSELFMKLKETYYSQRGCWGRFLLKGVVEVQMTGFTRRELCSSDARLGAYGKLSYEILSPSLDTDDIISESSLLHCFLRPGSHRNSTSWVRFLSSPPAAWPISTEDHHRQGAVRQTPKGTFIPARLLVPSLSCVVSGEGLLVVEGWLFRRIFEWSLAGVLGSAVLALCWACARDVGEGFAIGSYVLAAEVVGMALLCVASVLA